MSDEMSEEMDKELGRWQEAIRELLIKRCGEPIDGRGCDSGDALDLTLAEIHEGLNHLDEKQTNLKTYVDTTWTALTRVVGVLVMVEQTLPGESELRPLVRKILEQTPQDAKDYITNVEALKSAVKNLRAEWESDCGVHPSFTQAVFETWVKLEGKGQCQGSTESHPTESK